MVESSVAAAHGVAAADGGTVVHFAIGLWPYDLLLRFGYDLPENEHMWEGEWFDDSFETAALDLRSNAAKLILAVRAMHESLQRMESAGAGEVPVRDIRALKSEIERAPLALDLVLSYLKRLQLDVAAITPNCFGLEGRAIADSRDTPAALAASAPMKAMDPELAALFAAAPATEVRTNRPDLYVITENDGFNAALPKAAARALRQAAAITITAAAEIDVLIAEHCRWFDAVLTRLQIIVSERAEDGEDLLERWSLRDWTIVSGGRGRDAALEAHFPQV